MRFQLSHAQDPLSERDERTAAFVDAPADLVPGTYEGGLKTWECALDLAAYLDRDVLLGAHVGVAAGRRVRGSRVLEVGFCSSAWPSVVVADEGGCGFVSVLVVRVVGLRDCSAYAPPLGSPLCVFSFRAWSCDGFTFEWRY